MWHIHFWRGRRVGVCRQVDACILCNAVGSVSGEIGGGSFDLETMSSFRWCCGFGDGRQATRVLDAPQGLHVSVLTHKH